ncbi:restriction endonuclease subunit S [Pseudanabaena sp. UWO311]|uniref:restriction endonuclease subunit S n=1 Tax=Pseudanabaena sp. UWO311 TaxID=2487337 RepID=UPI00115A0A67|nr:restriction endonuclease subunit S [Pseudanabaena sp. UWO311]TYQ24030.1 restriction endonuclease subunit S [Pseudanabaena sp. UWO311]
MNNETILLLEKYFDVAFAAPDGVKKLRELILSLAMQGKLVPQDPSDQSARELLKEIEAEKSRLVKDGKIKPSKPLPEIKLDEVPYDLPKSWEWVRLGEIANYNGRTNINPEQIESETWLLDLEDIEKDTSRIIYRAKYSERESKSTKSTFLKGDVLYGKLRPYLNKVVVADDDGICTTEIVPIVLFGKVDPHFLRWALKRPAFLDYVNTLMYGVKMPRLGTEQAVESIHPLPPIAEQRRIVAKIDELMARCDDLEKLRQVHAQKQITVHNAALNQLLTAKDHNDFKTSWHFITQHFGELYSVKANVTELRKAILQLAVMGKLVPQDPNDQPASELLNAIEVEKNRLVKEGKIKASKPLPEIKLEEVPYDLPANWKWVRVIDIVDVGTGSTPATTNSEYYNGNIPWYTSSATNDSFAKIPETFITEKALKETNCKIFPSGSLIIAMYGQGKTRGQISEIVLAGATNQAIAAMGFYESSKELKQYIKYYFVKIYDEIRSIAEGAAQPNLNVGKIKETLIPLPPLAEQHRIVAKIDQLMTLCDELEKQIDIANSKKTNLLNSVMTKV